MHKFCISVKNKTNKKQIEAGEVGYLLRIDVVDIVVTSSSAPWPQKCSFKKAYCSCDVKVKEKIGPRCKLQMDKKRHK